MVAEGREHNFIREILLHHVTQCVHYVQLQLQEKVVATTKFFEPHGCGSRESRVRSRESKESRVYTKQRIQRTKQRKQRKQSIYEAKVKELERELAAAKK